MFETMYSGAWRWSCRGASRCGEAALCDGLFGGKDPDRRVVMINPKSFTLKVNRTVKRVVFRFPASLLQLSAVCGAIVRPMTSMEMSLNLTTQN